MVRIASEEMHNNVDTLQLEIGINVNRSNALKPDDLINARVHDSELMYSCMKTL